MTASTRTGPGSEPRWFPWLRTVARLAVGGVLLAAGLSKVADPLAMVNAVRNYQVLPDAAAQAVGYTLPGVEIVIGLLLIIGVAVRLASLVSLALMVAFIAGVAQAWARGLSIDCGCFGPADGTFGYDVAVAEYVTVIVRDTVLAAAAVLTAWRPTSRLALLDRVAADPPSPDQHPATSTDQEHP